MRGILGGSDAGAHSYSSVRVRPVPHVRTYAHIFLCGYPKYIPSLGVRDARDEVTEMDPQLVPIASMAFSTSLPLWFGLSESIRDFLLYLQIHPQGRTQSAELPTSSRICGVLGSTESYILLHSLVPPPASGGAKIPVRASDSRITVLMLGQTPLPLGALTSRVEEVDVRVLVLEWRQRQSSVTSRAMKNVAGPDSSWMSSDLDVYQPTRTCTRHGSTDVCTFCTGT